MSQNAITVDRVLHNAKNHAKRGERDKAQALYRAVLECYPKNRRALKGLQSLETGSTKISGSPALSRQQADGLLALQREGRYQDVVLAGLALAQQHPNEPLIFYLVGTALSALGRKKEAVASYRRVLVLKPDHEDALYNLGNALFDLGRYEEAVDSQRKALAITPDRSDMHNNLGNALRHLGRHDEAVVSYRKALALNPELVVAHSNLGASLNDLGRRDEAIASYCAAVELDPHFANAHNNLGAVLNEIGRHDEALASFERALEISPGFAECHCNVCYLRHYTPDDPLLHHMEAAYASPDQSANDRMHLGFALGKAYDDIGEVDKAFACLVEGNSLIKRAIGYDIEEDRMLFERIRSVFESAGPATPVPPGPQTTGIETTDRELIFVVGMPRSGTTLVETILDSHSRVFGAGELDVPGETLQRKFQLDAGDAPLPLNEDIIGTVREVYRKELDRLGADEPVIVDKMPINFRWIGFLFQAFPGARVVNLRRTPEAVCWSIYRQFFASSGNRYAFDLEDIATYHRLYEELMDFWRANFPGRILDLDYESLTEDQEAETARLLQYCGLEWEDQCLDFHKTERAVRTASALQVRKAMYTGSSQAWRRYEKHLQPMLRALEIPRGSGRDAA